jgi:archaellum biogenesis protein FlaJ (TadC family)
MTRRAARIQKWAIIAFAIVEAAIIALVVMTRIRGG